MVTRTFCGVPCSAAKHQKSATTSEGTWSRRPNIIHSRPTISQNLCGGGGERWKMWKCTPGSPCIAPTTRCCVLISCAGSKRSSLLFSPPEQDLWSGKCPVSVRLYGGRCVLLCGVRCCWRRAPNSTELLLSICRYNS